MKNHQSIIEPQEFDLVQVKFARRNGFGINYGGCDVFSSYIVCGDCGRLYDLKDCHSNSEYRRTIWQGNKKLAGERKC